jgi:hypothetical protein
MLFTNLNTALMESKMNRASAFSKRMLSWARPFLSAVVVSRRRREEHSITSEPAKPAP